MVSPCDGDEDREKAIMALLHVHNADIDAQDGKSELLHMCTVSSKAMQTCCNTTTLELQQPSVHLECLCNIVQCQDCISKALLNVMWP